MSIVLVMDTFSGTASEPTYDEALALVMTELVGETGAVLAVIESPA